MLVYHYCSIESFKSIVESKSLYLCDCYCSNDYSEENWSFRIIYKYLDEYVKKGGNPFVASRMFELIKISLKDRFMCCFSEECDLLSQWRGYASNGKGICVGFNTAKMRIKNTYPFTSAVLDHTIGLLKINYSIEQQTKSLHSLLNSLLDSVQLNDQGNIEKYDYILPNKIAQLTCEYKNPAFGEEKEWRIIYTPFMGLNDQGKMVMDTISECLFRNSQCGISPYFVWKFSDFSEIIEEVVLGPQYPGSESNVDFFLKCQGFTNVNIHRSQATYRG